MVLFVIASFLCALAPTLSALILFRVLQGAVAGPMIPLSQSLLLASYPKNRAGTALAMWSITTLVAPVVGPLLGGWITDNISWPWIFYINVPGRHRRGLRHLGDLPQARDRRPRRLPIDKVGLGLLVLWVGSLQVMLDKGKDLDWFNSPQIVALLCVAVVGFVVFLIWELTEEHPIVDLSLFKRRNFTVGTRRAAVRLRAVFRQRGAAAAVAAAVHGLYRDPGRAGARAGGCARHLAHALRGALRRPLRSAHPRDLSFAVFALVLFMRAHFNTDATIGTLLIPTIIQGAGMAAFFIPLMSITLCRAAAGAHSGGLGTVNFARITAGSFGTSITTTLWDRRATLHHAQLVEHLDPSDPVTAQALGTLHAGGLGTRSELRASEPPGRLAGVHAVGG